MGTGIGGRGGGRRTLVLALAHGAAQLSSVDTRTRVGVSVGVQLCGQAVWTGERARSGAEPHGEAVGNLVFTVRAVFGVYQTVLSPVLGLENSVASD